MSMQVTEHYGNFSPDWQEDEIEALMRLVKEEINDNGDKSIGMFYAKIYGKLMGMKHDIKN
jgi:hypothetical protein